MQHKSVTLEGFKTSMESAYKLANATQENLKIAKATMVEERRQSMKMKSNIAALQREISDKVGSTFTLHEVLRLLQYVRSTVAALQKSWVHLVDYFDKMNTNIDTALGDNLRTFVDTASETAELTKKGYGDIMYKLMDKNSVYTVSMAHIIEKQTELYLDVSRNLIMTPLANLQKLLVMNNEEEIDQANKALLETLKETEEEIQKIVDEAEENFEESAKERIFAIHKKLQDLQATATADINNSVGLYNRRQKHEGKPTLQPRRRGPKNPRKRKIPGMK